MTPIRTCVGCRAAVPAIELIRVVSHEGVLKQSRESQGRGAWLHPQLSCVERADKRRAWGRAFRSAGTFDSSELIKHI